MGDTPYGLGRIHVPDARDRAYRMAAPPSRRTFRNWLVPGGVSDQGDTPQCVAYACEAWLRAHPVVNASRPATAISRAELYHEAQQRDPWEGESYDGTTVRAGFKALQDRGYVLRYTWAWDAPTVTQHLLEVGPVVVGTRWDWRMFTPDRYSYVWPGDGSAGGHAYLLTAVNLHRGNPDGSVGAFRIQNSWSQDWGDAGRVWITLHSMAELMQDDGEACTASEARIR